MKRKAAFFDFWRSRGQNVEQVEVNMQVYDLNEVEADAVNASYLRKAVYGETLAVAQVDVQKGEVTEMHSHDTEEVIYVLKGAWLFHLPDGDVVLKDNQMLCIPAGSQHSSEVLEDTVAIDICSKNRPDWQSGGDKVLHSSPEQFLWGV
jgi:unsaturated pyranuronate lyase